MLVSLNGAQAFDVDGLKSGMSIEQAKSVIEKYSYGKVEIEENQIRAWDPPGPPGVTGRFIVLNFCKGKLALLQKHLKPRFDYFVRLVQEKRRELGPPVDAWSRPTDIKSHFESNSIYFLWKDGLTFIFIKVSYTEFGSNNQLDITNEIRNECWQIPY